MTPINRLVTAPLVIAASIGLALLGVTAFAAVSTVIAVGTMAETDLFDGPASITMRTLTIDPDEVLGWHFHPGVGAYTIVKTGTLTVEDGCGGETVYSAGQAFLEPPGRVHRGKNLGNTEVVTAQTFIVPLGAPTTMSVPQLCGRPAEVADCRHGAWSDYTHPRPFKSQGDCEQYVIAGK